MLSEFVDEPAIKLVGEGDAVGQGMFSNVQNEHRLALLEHCARNFQPRFTGRSDGVLVMHLDEVFHAESAKRTGVSDPGASLVFERERVGAGPQY